MINKSIKKIQKSRRLRHQRLAPMLACAIFLLCSCNSEFMSPDGENGESVPLSISGLHLEGSLNEENEPDAVTRAVATRAVTTRVSTGTVTTDGAIIKVFQLATNGYMGEYNVKCTYTTSDGTPQWKLAKVIGIDKRSSSIVGVYDPNGLGVFPDSNTGTVTSVNLTAQVFDEKKLWYLDTSHTNVTNTSPTVAFKMAPAYSRIKLSIQRHATNYVSGNCAITNVNLKSGTVFYSNNSMNISSGAVQGNATAGGWTYPLNTGNIAAGATNTAYDVLVPPQSVSSGLTITLTIDNTNRAITIPATQFTSSALAAGQQYTIPLMITDTAVTPSGNVTITDYATDDTTIKNDTPTEL